MHPVNLYRLQINDFALGVLKHLCEDEKVLNEIKLRYNNVLYDIQNCIKYEEYNIFRATATKPASHVALIATVKVRFAEKINELNYENLCDICCEIFKYTKQKMPGNIHKRIIFGKMNHASREYARLTL